MNADIEIVHPAPGAIRRAAAGVERAGVALLGGWRLPLFITIAAGALRFWRLGYPAEIVPLDETYYAPNGFGYLCHGTDMTFSQAGSPQTCAGLAPTFAVHPPAGKLLIALGIKAFGYTPFGWRAAAAAAGSVSVLLIYLIGRRLWGSRALAAAAAILLGVEGLQFVQSRLAMLDIFLSMFILLGVWLLLEDRDRARDRGPRWWRLGSGVAFGLAISSKWAAAPLLAVVAAVAFAWEIARARDARTPPAEPAEPAGPAELAEPAGEVGALIETPVAPPVGEPGRRGPGIVRRALAVIAMFGILPALVYVGSYGTWFASTKRYVPPRCYDTVGAGVEQRSVPKAGLSLWWCNQREIYDYHRNLKARDEKGNPIHPYMSQAWSWPWISRPAAHYFKSYCLPDRTAPECTPSRALRDEEILGLPNPVVWWTGFFIALPGCIWWMLRRRDDVAALLVVLFAPLVLPWFVTTRPLFMFYMTPAVPFIVLMVVHAMHRWRLRASAVAYVAIAVAAFAYFYPVLAAAPLPAGGPFGWESRIWFGHGFAGDCTSSGIKLLCWI